MSDQELQAFLEELSLAVHWEARATRMCIVVMAGVVILCYCLLA